jgi:energy-coupling factor transporter transmembrane protein EcfT
MVRSRNPIRLLFAALVLVCLATLFLTPNAISTVVVHSHTNGKQFVRVIGFLTMIFLAAGMVQGMLYIPGHPHGLFRQVYIHGFGPDPLDKTCARLC